MALRLYFEARERNIALYTQIIYDEYLTMLIGQQFEDPIYDEELDPRVSEEFANAAWRVYGKQSKIILYFSFLLRHFRLSKGDQMTSTRWSKDSDAD